MQDRALRHQLVRRVAVLYTNTNTLFEGKRRIFGVTRARLRNCCVEARTNARRGEYAVAAFGIDPPTRVRLLSAENTTSVPLVLRLHTLLVFASPCHVLQRETPQKYPGVSPFCSRSHRLLYCCVRPSAPLPFAGQ